MFDPTKVDLADCRDDGALFYSIPTRLVLLLREYFQSKYVKFLPVSQRYVYYANGSTTAAQDLTEIEIFRLGDEQSNKTAKPKILVRREAAAEHNPGLGSNVSIIDRSKSVVRDHVASSSIVFCMGQTVDEADIIAAEVWAVLRHFQQPIRQRLGCLKFRASQLGKTGRLRDFPAFFATPVVVDYLYEDVLQLSIGDLPLRDLQIEVQ